MSEKIASGIGVPFVDAALTSSPSLGDGYSYQLDLADPRTASGWVSGPLLHDGSTTTGYATTAGGATRYISLLVTKASGMTFDNIVLSAGYANALTTPVFYGSNDLASWTPISLNTLPATDFHSSFSYVPGMQWGHGSSVTFKYLAFSFADTSGGTAQVGCADIRVQSGVVEVGP